MNLPNTLSLIRIIMVPFLIFFYLASFIPCGKVIAIVLFFIAALTDLLDGKIARKYNLVTDLGKLLDPIADKILVLSALLLVVFDNTVVAPFGVLCAIIIIARDYVVDALRQISASKGVVIPADKWGKFKTILLDIALPLLMLYSYLKNYSLGLDNAIIMGFGIVAQAIFVLAVLLTILSGINYIVKNRTLLGGKQE